ncbi:GRB2-associated-binding protein 3 [Tinamus guttatus]|uniref:GRB2-associated-binding protein 3 n=1 Tax=Tinamus guttatus TaxID=94827 RepID=A0A099YTX5_TINGU|nr:PREDICTED: GRB2-associated-binding protein 3 [Tinamus guttatus]XP_010214083.1 PREDICTED: GRB2-associated-binding protein 3 [Tinamus guttatus]KGL72801.1 GRB2-associated-binding protein 3 [Tinamus guttatus]
MSSGDVVCTGWLIKSPPEKKLKRYAWRKRWFVLRRGRMSGNPDVLEYYRNNHSKKPIRIIDLNECEVLKHSGPNFIKKEFQNNFVFIVRTTYRTFYLVAKTEEEMQIWVHNISQICNFGHLEDGTDSVETLSHTTSSPQPSPAASTHASRVADPSFSVDGAAADPSAAEETPSESESIFLPDYLFLSNCESGKLGHNRCDSWSNSDRSLEQTSSDDVFVDSLQSQPSLYLVQPSSAGVVHQDGASAANHGAISRSIDITGPSCDFSSSSPLLGTPLTPTLQIDKSQNTLPYGVTKLDVLSNTPPPRPPKPTHFSDRRGEEPGSGALHNGHAGICRAQVALVPRRISLSSLDNVRNWKADMEGSSLRSRDKRLSLNLPCRFSPLYSTASDSAEDSYVPMRPSTSPSVPGSNSSSDGYIPMSPGSATFTFPVISTEKLTSPLPELPSDLEPPPVNRDLKPRRKSRPPPLDLRNLSTIREHAAVTRMWTVPYNRMSFISPERDGINSARIFANSVSGEEEESYIHMEHRQATSPYNGAFPWTRKSNLDYLALDFNSASPSPVQKKPFLSEEQRVDYVQVDEQKTQALQNTKQEWTDERQSKV